VTSGAGGGTDAQRLTELFRSHQGRILGFARRRVGADAAQEVVAETFLVAWRHLDDIPDPALPWLYRVASLEIANLRRRQVKSLQIARAVRASVREEAVHADGGGELDAARTIAAAFERLEQKDQEILRLATWEGLTSAEGASVLGCSISAYRVRLHRARGRLTKGANLRDSARRRHVPPEFSAHPMPTPPGGVPAVRRIEEAG
jgi:RNA polymerase sigma-70 factor (ECF subfamily)